MGVEPGGRGVFRVPNDGGPPLVRVPGAARLLIEIAFFGAAERGFYRAVSPPAAYIFAAVVLAHYAASCDRLAWLLRQ